MGNKMLVGFLVSWVVNVVLLWLLALIFKDGVVLGNARLSMLMSAVFSGLILTALGALVEPSVKASGYKVKSYGIWTAIYFTVNVLGLWIIKRFADATGLGISSVLNVLIVAAVITVVQVGVAKYTMPRKK